ncbi:MAG: LptA/(LptD N-terminal domain) transport protein [Pseudomonadota bacterium]|jgi:lipopolysaccharide transport protein LptA
MTPALVLLLAVAAPSSELTLTSDAFEIDGRTHEGHAAGSVHAANDLFDVVSDEARVRYDRRPQGSPVVTVLTLTGHVRARRLADGLEAVGARAVWDRRSGRVELFDGPSLRRGEAVVAGERIALSDRDDRIEVDAPVVSAPSGAGGAARITAHALSVTGGGGRALFTGDVRLVEGAREARSARLDVRLSRGPGDTFALVRARSSGDVRLRDDRLRSVSEAAEYEASTRTVTLTGSPRLTGPAGELSGERIVYDGRSGRARSERAKVRLKETGR